MKVQLSQVHWGRVAAAVILTVFLTLTLNLIVDLLVFQIWNRPDQEQIVRQVLFWNPTILPILLTFAAALWVVRKTESKPQLHGLLVGLLVALILFFFSSGFQGEFVLVTLINLLLTIAAGWLGGVLGSWGGKSQSQLGDRNAG
jgi:putative membrane protein (TIGR04086 family)